MTVRASDQDDLGVIEPDEHVHARAEANGAHLLVTDRRVIVADGTRIALDVGYRGLRRIQFDIERNRPATLVIVPDDPAHEPQVLAVPRDNYEEVTAALAAVGQRLAEADSAD